MKYSKIIALLIFFLAPYALYADKITIATIDPSEFKEYKKLVEQAITENSPHLFAIAPEDLPESDDYWQKKLQKAQLRKDIQQNDWILGAQVDGKLIGLIEAERAKIKETYMRHLITITKVYVNHKHQKKGIGILLTINLLDLLAQDPTITALDFRVPTNQIDRATLFGFKAVNPHEYAVSINGKFYPHYFLKTTMQEAFTKVKELESKTKGPQVNITTLTPDEFEKYREIDIRSLEGIEPHLFAIDPEENKLLPKEYWLERLNMAQSQENKQQNLWILAAKNDNGNVVGFIEAVRESATDSYKKHCAILDRMFVDKDYSGKGIAKYLMFKMISLLHEDNSITALECWAADKHPAIPFYKSLSFKEANPDNYAVQVHGEFYPFTLMATKMKTALKRKEKIEKLLLIPKSKL